MPKLELYRIEVSPAINRDLQKLKYRIRLKGFQRLGVAISALASEPRYHGIGKIRGAKVAYRVRISSYRVVYEVHDAQHLTLILQVTRRTETTYSE